jgi:hypothetical protein
MKGLKGYRMLIFKKSKTGTKNYPDHDLDFGTIMKNSGDSFPRSIIFRWSDFRPLEVNRHRGHVLHESGDSLILGAIIPITSLNPAC